MLSFKLHFGGGKYTEVKVNGWKSCCGLDLQVVCLVNYTVVEDSTFIKNLDDFSNWDYKFVNMDDLLIKELF